MFGKPQVAADYQCIKKKWLAGAKRRRLGPAKAAEGNRLP
jgi:hypothetical protein